jgi:hypothetical protein
MMCIRQELLSAIDGDRNSVPPSVPKVHSFGDKVDLFRVQRIHDKLLSPSIDEKHAKIVYNKWLIL